MRLPTQRLCCLRGDEGASLWRTVERDEVWKEKTTLLIFLQAYLLQVSLRERRPTTIIPWASAGSFLTYAEGRRKLGPLYRIVRPLRFG